MQAQSTYDTPSFLDATAKIPNTRIPTNGRQPSAPYLPGIPPITQNISSGQDSNNMSFHNSSLDSPQNFIARPPQQPTSLKQRRTSFLNGLATFMSSCGTPLPPTLTGISYPQNYDPSTSPWKFIEPSQTEIGSFRLAGKDVDLFKLWGLVLQAGGGTNLTQQRSWSRVLQHFDLPEQFSSPQPNGQTSVANTLERYYKDLLDPFEAAYKRNVQEHQRRALMSAGRQPAPPIQQLLSTGSASGQGRPHQPQNGSIQSNFPEQAQATAPTNATNSVTVPQPITSNHHPQPSHSAPAQPQPPPSAASIQRTSPVGTQPQNSSLPDSVPGTGQISNGVSDKNILEPDVQGIKRKLDSNEADGKRAKQKLVSNPLDTSPTIPATDNRPSSTNPTSTTTTIPTPPRRVKPTRRKIEYVPLGRDVVTFGGRDLTEVDEDGGRMQRRSLRDLNDWGTVDIEALTMSIRSRLAIELSYALTTFTLLSTMKGQTPGSGFPIFQCVDLLDEALDLLEDEAFHGEEETLDSEPAEDSRITTHRQLIKMIFEEESEVFAGLTHRPGSNNPNFGSRQRPGGIILTITNIIRNLSIIPDNISFLAQHERLLDLMLRVCTVTHDGCKPLPASPVLSPSDLIIARKDVLYTLINLTGMIQFSTHSTRMMRVARRAFTLVASYLIDPAECVSPLAYIQQSGVLSSGNLKPPSLSDIALEVFTRLSQSDSNRQVLSQILPQTTVWSLLEALVHRLPILDADFQLVARELWLSYVEKIVMAIYSLAFLAPPQLKLKIKTDRNLGFTKVMFRMVQKFLTNPHPDGRVWFSVCARRAIEAMKVVDDGEDVFDTSQAATSPTISFGMGYGEVGESDKQTGTGLLGGYREVTWDLLMLREVDDVMFAELESMARVG